MNCLWEVMLKAKEQGVPEKNIRFQVSRAFSPYMEVSCPCLNQDTLEDIPVIEVNPYYRFYSIFKDLCHPSKDTSSLLRPAVFWSQLRRYTASLASARNFT